MTEIMFTIKRDDMVRGERWEVLDGEGSHTLCFIYALCIHGSKMHPLNSVLLYYI